MSYIQGKHARQSIQAEGVVLERKPMGEGTGPKTPLVVDLIYECADKLYADTTESVNLEKKIVLSIAIRLKTEEFLIRDIADPEKVKKIERNQTIELFNIYKEKHMGGDGQLKLIEQVNLMTPENIHFNSFMYEPILDMSDQHLKQLYDNVKGIIISPVGAKK